MIAAICREQLPACLEILKCGYENTAVTFGMTEENCPYRGRTRLPYQVLAQEYDNGCMMYAYMHNQEIVGFLSLSADGQTLHINDIVIHPRFQNHGFGSALMRFAKEQAKALHCTKIKLGMVHDNLPLRRWYEKAGFVTTKLIKYDKVSYTVGTMEFVL